MLMKSKAYMQEQFLQAFEVVVVWIMWYRDTLSPFRIVRHFRERRRVYQSLLYGFVQLYPSAFLRQYFYDDGNSRSLRKAQEHHLRYCMANMEREDVRFSCYYIDVITRFVLKVWEWLYVVLDPIFGFIPHPPLTIETVSLETSSDNDPTLIDLFYTSEKLNSSSLDGAILHCHGGSFTTCDMPLLTPFFSKLLQLTDKAGLNLVIAAPRYSLAPESSFPRARNQIFDTFFKYLGSQFHIPPSKIVVMGDSAGGNLAASLAVQLREENIPSSQPAGTVLISPWLDLSFMFSRSSPNLNKDWLSGGMDKLHASANEYKRELNSVLGSISPLFARLRQDMSPFLVTLGDTEIFLQEGLKWAERAKKSGIDVDVVIGKDAAHNFAVMPFVYGIESLTAIHRIASFTVNRLRLTAGKAA